MTTTNQKRGPPSPESPPKAQRPRSTGGASIGWALPPAARTAKSFTPHNNQAFAAQTRPFDATPSIFSQSSHPNPPHQSPSPPSSFPFMSLPPEIREKIIKEFIASRGDKDSRNHFSQARVKNQDDTPSGPATKWKWMEPLFLTDKVTSLMAEAFFYGELEVYADQLERLLTMLTSDVSTKRQRPLGSLVHSLLIHARYVELKTGLPMADNDFRPSADIALGDLHSAIAQMPGLAVLHVRGSRAQHFFTTSVLPAYRPPTHHISPLRGIHLIFEVATSHPRFKEDTLSLGMLRQSLGGTVVEKLTMGPFIKTTDAAAQRPPRGALFPLLRQLSLDVVPAKEVFTFLERMVRGDNCEGPALELIRLADRDPVRTHIDKVKAYKASLERLNRTDWQTERFIGGVLRQIAPLSVEIISRGTQVV